MEKPFSTTIMTTNDILEKLKSELGNIDGSIAALTKERHRIAGAVAALEGKPATPPPGAPPATKPTPVTELVLEAARALPVGATFDYKSILAKAQTEFPTQSERLKTGVYTAVRTLLTKKQLKIAPGGYQLNPEAKP